MKIRINGEEKIIDTHKKNLTLAEILMKLTNLIKNYY